MKNNTNVVKISQADFNTILLHAEKISNGQFDFIQVLREELKNKLGIEDADSLIDFLKTTPAEYVMETRLFLAQFNFIIEGDGVNFRLVKLNDNYCELEPIPENTAAIVPAENNNAVIPAPTLDQRVIKIQFHLQNMANSAIIIGQELTECKKEVGHGNWADWLKSNFNLSQRTANTFMQIFSRFSNSQTFANLGYSQMIQMLALPEGEEEEFIAEKAANGTPVEDMTVKQLRAEIKDWKTEAEKQKKRADTAEDIFQTCKKQYAGTLQAYNNNRFELQAQKKIAEDNAAKWKAEAEKIAAENEELKNKPPQVIETTKTIMPPNYLETIQHAEELQEQVDQLLEQNQDLQNQVIDAASKQGEPPVDYLELEKKLATAQAELADAKEAVENAKEIAAAEKFIEQLFQASDALTNSLFYHKALENYMQKHPNTKDKIGALRCIWQQLDSASNAISAGLRFQHYLRRN